MAEYNIWIWLKSKRAHLQLVNMESFFEEKKLRNYGNETHTHKQMLRNVIPLPITVTKILKLAIVSAQIVCNNGHIIQLTV